MDEIIKQRLDKIEALKRKGLSAYPAKFIYSTTIAEALTDLSEDKIVRLSGRIMAKRVHGKAGFADLRDSTGKIQLYVKEGLIDRDALDTFLDLDIGDIVGVEGKPFKTRTGEPTVNVSQVWLLAKAIRTLPEKWHGLRDVETRYRHRYLDLLSNPEVKDVFLLRSRLVSKIREFLDKRGFLEVETPMLQPIPGGAVGRPFKTHHNVLDVDLYLRIAPELYLKRLLVAGLDKVYELNKSFRNEGISTRHNPEFTMLEVYSAYDDYRDMMSLTEGLIKFLADELLKSSTLRYQGRTIDLNHWQKVSFAKIMKEDFDIGPDDSLDDWLKKLAKKGIEPPKQDISRSLVANLIADSLALKQNNPVFVTDIFTELCPLAKKKSDNPLLSERFELFISDIEVANGYSELNDPCEQKERFLEDLKETKDIDTKLDTDYIEALEYGMPPAGGLGIGIDRLVMIFANQPSIRDVILFPQLKPK